MVGVERIAEAQAWVDAHGRRLAPDALAGELLERFGSLGPQDYAALLERAGLRLEPAFPAEEETDPVTRARELIIFCDGLEEAGEWDRYIGRARMVARDVLALATMAADERSAREAAFAERDRWQAVALSYSRRAQVEDDEEPGPE